MTKKGPDNAPGALYTGATMAQSRIGRTLRGDAARLRIIAILSQERCWITDWVNLCFPDWVDEGVG